MPCPVAECQNVLEAQQVVCREHWDLLPSYLRTGQRNNTEGLSTMARRALVIAVCRRVAFQRDT